jgi:hypothetical protein
MPAVKAWNGTSWDVVQVAINSGAGGGTGERKPWDVAGDYPLHANGDELDYLNYTDFSAAVSVRNMDSGDFFFPGGGEAEFALRAQGDALYLPAPAATSWELVIELSNEGGNPSAGQALYNMAAIICVDSSGNGIGYSGYGDGSFYQWLVSGWAYAGTGNSASVGGSSLTIADGRHFWYLLKKSSGSYQGGVSFDGATIVNRPTAQSPTAFTPAYIGIGRLFTSSGTQWRKIHRINIYEPSFTP